MKIVWTRLALSDLDEAYNYIASRQGRIASTRELVVDRTPFIVPYRVRGEQVEILAGCREAPRHNLRFGVG